MVKKNSQKIINNDEFPPLPTSPSTTDIRTPTGTGQVINPAWSTVQRRKGKSVSPTLQEKQISMTSSYKNAAKSKTVRSPKRPKPSSSTDRGSASKRKPNPSPSVKIKQEFIDRVDTTKGLAPIFGSADGQNTKSENAATTGTYKGGRSRDDEVLTEERRQNGYGRGTTRGRSRGKRDRVNNTRTSMRLRSIGESTDAKASLGNSTKNASGDDDESMSASINAFHEEVNVIMEKNKIQDDRKDYSSDSSSLPSSSDDDDIYSISETRNSPIKARRIVDPQHDEKSDENSTATEFRNNIGTSPGIIHNMKGDEFMPTGLEPTSITPSREIVDLEVNNTPRLGNMFGLMKVFSPISKVNEGKTTKATIPTTGDDNKDNYTVLHSDGEVSDTIVAMDTITPPRSSMTTNREDIVVDVNPDENNTVAPNKSREDTTNDNEMGVPQKNEVLLPGEKKKRTPAKTTKVTKGNSGISKGGENKQTKQGKKGCKPPKSSKGGSTKPAPSTNNKQKNRYKPSTKKTTQTRLAPIIDPIHAREHQLRYDMRLQLDKIMEEPESTKALVAKFRALFKKVQEEESSAILYPYSTTSSAVPITDVARLPNTYTELRRYIPTIKPPLKNSDLVYGQVYIGTNSAFDDWKTTFLEWTRNHGHGLYIKFVQDERTIPMGYLLSTHKMSNSPWYQELLSSKSGIKISTRFRKISGQKSKERSAVHLECSRDSHEQVKAFLRIHFSKTTKPPFLTGFPVIFIPDKMHISNKHAKSGAQIVATRQGNIINKIQLRTSWSIFGIDMINKKHGISLRTMISRIMWDDADGKKRQLYHSVDSTWNDEGTIFGWHPQFEDQAQTVMTGLLPYLKGEYGDSVESYFSQGAVDMQSKQRWDSEKGGVIGEDDEFIATVSKSESWWDDEDIDDANTSDKPKVVIDAKNIITRDVPDEEDNASIPTLNTKVEGEGVDNAAMMQSMLSEPPPLRRNNANDDTTVSSSLTMKTMDTRLDNMENKFNFMNCMLQTIMKNTGTPTPETNKEQKLNNTQTNTTVVGAPSPSDQVK